MDISLIPPSPSFDPHLRLNMFTPPPSPLPARSPSLPMRPPSISINSTYSEDDDSEIPSGAFKSHLNTPTVPTPASKWPTANPLGKKSSRRRIIIPLLAVALVLVAIASRLGSTSREGSPPPGHDRTHGDHVQPDIALEPHRDMHLKPGWRHSLHRAVAEAGALRTLPPHSDRYSHHLNTPFPSQSPARQSHQQRIKPHQPSQTHRSQSPHRSPNLSTRLSPITSPPPHVNPGSPTPFSQTAPSVNAALSPSSSPHPHPSSPRRVTSPSSPPSSEAHATPQST